MGRDFWEMVGARWDEGKFICVGLDSQEVVRMGRIVDKTRDLVCAYKPNLAFYGEFGRWEDLLRLVKYINDVAPDVPVILDGKFGDIGNTSEALARMAFDYFGADAVTVNPYFGGEALGPFLRRGAKGSFVLCRTSNPRSDEFQGLVVVTANGELVPLYQVVAHRVREKWNELGNCGLVVGATCPDELSDVRRIVGNEVGILVPGVGAQQPGIPLREQIAEVISAGTNCCGQGLIINLARTITESADPRAKVRELNDYVDEALQKLYLITD